MPSRPRIVAGLGVALSGLACPCHVLSAAALGLLAAAGGSAPALSPAIQDAVHAVYVPVAVASGGLLLSASQSGRRRRRARAGGWPAAGR